MDTDYVKIGPFIKVTVRLPEIITNNLISEPAFFMAAGKIYIGYYHINGCFYNHAPICQDFIFKGPMVTEDKQYIPVDCWCYYKDSIKNDSNLDITQKVSSICVFPAGQDSGKTPKGAIA